MKLLIGFAFSISATLLAAAAPPPPAVVLDHRGLQVGSNRFAPVKLWSWKSVLGLGEPSRTVRLANILHIYDPWGIAIYEPIPPKGPAGSVSAVTIYLRSEGDGPVYPRACYTQSVLLEKVSLDARSLVTANVLRSALKGWSCEEIMPTTFQFSYANLRAYFELSKDQQHLTSLSVSLSTD